MTNKKVWIEISKKAVAHNIRSIRKLLKPKTKFFAVVKSNAYGHGIDAFPGLVETMGIDVFCVDSVLEGLRLRKNGITAPILVLGPTMFPELYNAAYEHSIAVTISNKVALSALLKLKKSPAFHVKIDTGMNRQGFQYDDLERIIKQIRNSKHEIRNLLNGIYTHFASAKDLNYPTFTDLQFKTFQKAINLFEKAGYTNLIKHAAATGGALVSKKYHLDAVRVGIGMYGLFPSKELEVQKTELSLKPALSWKALISEIKDIPKGEYVGYDLTERVSQKTKIAVIPIGYWHGFDRGLSHVGEVLIRGKRARVLGRVSMDLIVVDVTGLNVKVADEVVLIGSQGKGTITASEMASKISTSHYEVVTRLNPLIERILVR